MNVSKTKILVVGHGVQDLEMLPTTVDGGSIECVKEFQYLGSIIAADGHIDAEMDKRLANASRCLEEGCFHQYQPLSYHQETGIQSLCALSAAVWR